MTLVSGTRLGQYEVIGRLGAGGMGEVYRARDTRLARDVALKILPPSFAIDPDRLARFEREARALAALNHPGIAQIYGFEEHDGLRAIAMELVEGATLADHLGRGPMELSRVVPIAAQLAEAMDFAHERGILHRDLKPSNITITPEGGAKVLDFGLAKAITGEADRSEASQAPTLTAGGTRAGMILGTAAYMSPEQARGREVDKRTDIWAFGCVLYEMLAGRAAFAADTVSDTLACVLERDPDWTRLPARTPTHVRRVLRLCLEKDIRTRLRDMGDARLMLEAGDEAATSPTAATRRVGAWAIAALLAGVLASASVLAGLWPRGTVLPAPVTFTLTPPDGEAFDGRVIPSPDAQQMAVVTRNASGRRVVWVRPTGSAAYRLLEATEHVVREPFWSPDGRFLAFSAEGRLKKIDASGGAAVTICACQTTMGATWGHDNVIVFAPINRAPLQRVDAAGGSPQPLTTLNANRNENSHRWPHFLPDGRSFLFTARSDVLANNLVYVSSLDSNELTPILSAQSNAVYVTPGYLLFAQEGTLLAQAFDARLKALSGEAFPVIPRISHSTPSSSAAFAASAEMLTYTVADPRQPRLAWLDRAGTVEQWIGEQWARPDTVDLRDIRLAPGETRAALVTTNSISGNRDIQLLHFATNNLTRFTSHGANDWWPTWSPDGRRLAFATDREGKSTVYVKNTSGGDESRLLHVPDRGTFPKDWSPDGRMISLNIDTPDGVASIWAARVEGDRTPFPLNQSDVRETNAMFSPDGRWVVYESAESGANEIYVKPIDRADKIRLSQAGGFAPRWPRQAREIIYRTPNGDVMSVALKDGRPDAPAPAVRLFSGCGSSLPLAGIPINYDVTPNATRFLMACPPDDARPEVVTVALHWTSSLRAR